MICGVKLALNLVYSSSLFIWKEWTDLRKNGQLNQKKEEVPFVTRYLTNNSVAILAEKPLSTISRNSLCCFHVFLISQQSLDYDVKRDTIWKASNTFHLLQQLIRLLRTSSFAQSTHDKAIHPHVRFQPQACKQLNSPIASSSFPELHMPYIRIVYDTISGVNLESFIFRSNISPAYSVNGSSKHLHQQSLHEHVPSIKWWNLFASLTTIGLPVAMEIYLIAE